MGSEHSEKDCCSNEKVTLENLDNLFAYPTIDGLDNVEIQFVIAFITNFVKAKSPAHTPIEYLNYKPPLPAMDIQLLFSTFII